MNNKIVSVIIPTFNSERTLEKTLMSIKAQSIGAKKIDILVIDGGSKDNTLRIAKKFGARILKNAKTQQEYAKHIGLIKSKTQFAILLDSDEIFSSNRSVENRIKTIKKSKGKVHMVFSSGYKAADNALINNYVANFGDPFAYFMYGASPNFKYYLSDCKKIYKNYKENDAATTFTLGKESHFPLVDLCAGATIDIKYVKNKYKLKDNVMIVPKLPYMIMKDDRGFTVVKNEHIIHDSAESFSHFVNKLRWRAIVNVHYKDIPGTGYANREVFQPTWFNLKKLFFIPYSLTIVGPVFTTLGMIISRKNKSAILHIPLTLIITFNILLNVLYDLINYKPKLHIYGKTS